MSIKHKIKNPQAAKLLQILLLFLLSACSLLNPKLSASQKTELNEFKEFSAFPSVPSFDGDLFMVFAHADDELQSLAYAAQMRKLHPHKAIHWILVSDSGKGRASIRACGDKSIAECRRLEAEKAAKCIGLEAPYQMELPDAKLSEVVDLDLQLEEVITKLSRGKVGLILTHDQTGLYGHSDHVAVHDALVRVSNLRAWPLLKAAVPFRFREHIKISRSATGRTDEPVTHIVPLDEDLKKQLKCAIKAHRSQQFMLWAMRRFSQTNTYLNKVPLQFYNLADHQKGELHADKNILRWPVPLVLARD